MNTLVIGGTRFVGRHIVDALIRSGHSVTLFNRGSRADLYPQLEAIHGDRDDPASLEPLGARRWDAVVDTSAYRPEQVERLLAVLTGAPHYLFVSTVSVYDDPDEFASGAEATFGEDAPLRAPEHDTDEVTGATYGALKVACEEVAGRHAGPLTVVRPGIVVGPWDYTERFPYWPARAALGGAFVAPDDDPPLQWIDGRDLAAFVGRCLEAEVEGTYNLVTPPDALHFDALLRACRLAAEATEGAAPARAVRVPWATLERHGIEAWRDLPLLPPPGSGGLYRASPEAAVEAGLRFRDLGTTVRDTLRWLLERPGGLETETGLDRSRELDVLAELNDDATGESAG